MELNWRNFSLKAFTPSACNAGVFLCHSVWNFTFLFPFRLFPPKGVHVEIIGFKFNMMVASCHSLI